VKYAFLQETDKVDLHQESILLPQGCLGLACSFRRLDLAVEYDVATVNTLAFSVGLRIWGGQAPRSLPRTETRLRRA
jgi:hypothetical protein